MMTDLVLYLLLEVLWNNSRIMLSEKGLYNYHLISRGILTVRNLVDASVQLLGRTEAKQNYHLSSSQILNWLGPIKCILKTWRDLLLSTLIDNFKIEECPVNEELSAMTSKIAYQNLLQQKVLNNILYLDERLFKFNMFESLLCSLCNQASEFVLHLLCTCTKSHNLWRQLCAWLAYKNVMLQSNLEPQTAILCLRNDPM